MTILDNSALHLTTVLIFLFGLGALILSYMKRKYEYTAIGFVATLIGFTETVFIASVKGDLFILSDNIDYGANYLFSLAVFCLGIVSVTGLTIYYRIKIIPLMFIQLGIMLSSVLMLVTFGSSISHSISNRRFKNDENTTKFMKAEEFQKGSANPKLSKAGSGLDTISTR
jgi:hypothetical protein